MVIWALVLSIKASWHSSPTQIQTGPSNSLLKAQPLQLLKKKSYATEKTGFSVQNFQGLRKGLEAPTLQ